MVVLSQKCFVQITGRFIDEIGIEMVGRVNCLMFTMWDNTAQGSYPELFNMDFL